ncbi:MAG: DnaA/Hda family protein [Hyphomicrobiaceae bacterium]
MSSIESIPRQLVLELPHRAAFGDEDFLVSSSNAAATDLVDRWPDWPVASALVLGPARSGKSHLAHVWCRRSGAEIVAAATLDDAAIGCLSRNGSLVVEDLDAGIGDEKILFHILNLAREHRQFVLLTSSQAPGDLNVALPDLRSRLRALPVVQIETPDEELLRALLVKLFADRQLVVEPHVLAYLALHIERSTETAARIVEEIDHRALATRRKVTRALAAEVLGEVSSADAEDGPDLPG